MWSVIEEKDGQLYLFDGSEAKWLRKEDINKVIEYSSWRQYFMSFDFKAPDMWC